MTRPTIDPNCRTLRPLAAYSKVLPSSRSGKHINRATLFRWALKGVRNGVRLRTEVLGSCRYTCDAYVAEFMAALREGPALIALPAREPLDPRRRAEIAERFGTSV